MVLLLHEDLSNLLCHSDLTESLALANSFLVIEPCDVAAPGNRWEERNG